MKEAIENLLQQKDKDPLTIIFIKILLCLWIVIWLGGAIIGIRMLVNMAVSFYTGSPIFLVIFLFFSIVPFALLFLIYTVFRYLQSISSSSGFFTRIFMYLGLNFLVFVFFENQEAAESNNLTVSIVTFFLFLFYDFLYYNIIKLRKKN